MSQDETVREQVRMAPLSLVQERIWHHSQRDPESPLWRVVIAFRLIGPATGARIESAFGRILDRHPLLSCRFQGSADGGATCIPTAGSPSLVEEDLTSVDQEDLESELQWYLSDLLQEPMDPSRGPTMGLHLLEIGDDLHVLLCVFHRLVCDESCAGVLRAALSYALALPEGEAGTRLPGIEGDYAELASRQKGQLAAGAWSAQEGFWRGLLTPPPPALPLPREQIQRGGPAHQGASVEGTVPVPLATRLRDLADGAGSDEQAPYLCAFIALLYLLTDVEDIAVALREGKARAVTAGELIGPLGALWPIRLRPLGDTTFADLLVQTDAQLQQLSNNRDLPCDAVWRLIPEDQLPRWPAPVDVCFGFSRRDAPAEAVTGISIESLDLGSMVSFFDWELQVTALADGSTGLRLVYDQAWFHPDTIAQALAVYQTLLSALVEDPRRSILALVGPDCGVIERPDPRRLGDVRVQTSMAGDGIVLSQTLVERFEEIVARHPQRSALEYGDECLSYAELNRRANGLAHAVQRACGAAPRRVALLFSQGAVAVWAILGALKAGATYVPMDAQHPMHRLRLVAGDCEASAIVTTSNHRDLAGALGFAAEAIICADEIAPAGQGPVLVQRLACDDHAYILYTSGSTGVPKGVVQSHRNVLHFIRAYGEGLGIGPEDRMTLLASYSVDAGVMDIFGALLHGATLCPLVTSQGGFAEVGPHLLRRRISMFHSTPTVYRYFVETLGPGDRLDQVRLVIMGGEAVVRRDLDAFNRHFAPGCRFVNWLGSTESSLTLQYVMEHGYQQRRAKVPVGFPVADTDVVLLDHRGRETPLMGEIAVKSEHVAIGYWRQPEASARTFLPGERPGQRTYRSGDLARRLADGGFELIGRRDFQVKVRGFRVELGEVEAALGAHEQVARCAVIAAPDDSGGLYLKAFYVGTDSPSSLSGETLHRFLSERLPAYMIPSAFLPLKELPLTASGKIDRPRLGADAAGAAALG